MVRPWSAMARVMAGGSSGHRSKSISTLVLKFSHAHQAILPLEPDQGIEGHGWCIS